ncbi:MAG: hypothetical protein QOE14_658 [Humisphaera sp.]|nr:hypothetical protein [Humisphaera sp.]
MINETTAPPQAQQLAQIFQKAYARAVALQRMDEQISALLEQRQRLENEFREAQGEVNDECERMLKSASIAPAKILAQLAEAGGAGIATDPGSGVGGGAGAGTNGRLGRSRQGMRS